MGVAGIVGDVVLDVLGDGPRVGNVDRGVSGRVVVDGSLLILAT